MAELKLKAQLMAGDVIAFGPGKADLLDAIEQTGSISAAARHMGLSYRRAWLLVDTMNKCFAAPLVEAGHGGASRGGAHLTDFGRKVRAAYRDLQSAIQDAARPHIEELLEKLTK